MPKKKEQGGRREGAGRKVVNPEGPTVPLTASVPSTLVDRLNALAEKNGWGRSEAVTRAIRGFVGRRA